mgnify:CR=1 FL=1
MMPIALRGMPAVPGTTHTCEVEVDSIGGLVVLLVVLLVLVTVSTVVFTIYCGLLVVVLLLLLYLLLLVVLVVLVFNKSMSLYFSDSLRERERERRVWVLWGSGDRDR